MKNTLILSLFAVLAFVSCERSNNQAQVAFRLMDAPCDYEHVYIDVQGMEVHIDSTWYTLTPFNAGVYDILELANGLDTLLCDILLEPGKLSQLRLILGENNSLVLDGNSYDLKTPSAQQSGLKLNIHQDLLANTSYTVYLDFDACKSIVRKGNGDYSLKPVIRAFTDSTNGKLIGYVMPDSLSPVVNVIENSDTVTAIPNSSGFFMVCGLDGVYDVFIEANDTNYSDTLISNVTVSFGEIVDMDTITLK